AHIAVLVVLQRLSAHVAHDVVTEVAGLPHRVLGGGPAQRIRVVRGQVRDRGAVPSRPGAVDDGTVLVHDLQRGQGAYPAALVHRQVGVGQYGVGLHTSGPHQGVGVELVAVGGNHVVVLGGVQERVQLDVDTTAAQLFQRVATEPVPQLPGADGVEVLARGPGHVLDLADRLDTGKAPADEGEGQHPAAHVRVPGGSGHVHLVQHLVAHGDGFFDLLEADTVLRQARDGQHAGHRPQCNHHVVVGNGVVLTLDRGDGGLALGVVQTADPPGEHRAAVQQTAVRSHHVPRLDRPGCRFGQEGLVGHV